jgi:hypothetical protein
MKTCMLVSLTLVACLLERTAFSQPSVAPETVVVHNGSITLHALLWRPRGRGPFPAVLLNHGQRPHPRRTAEARTIRRTGRKLGPVFARHGYVFLFLFRQGVGLSADQGSSAIDLMNNEFAVHGQEARNALQLRLLENREN